MTHLPGAATAFVDPRKISAYLLNAAHPQNGGKAGFFRDHGFDAETLTVSLAEHPVQHPVATDQTSPHGRKFAVHCTLTCPDGRRPCITSIWIIDAGDERPRFVTAYPRAR